MITKKYVVIAYAALTIFALMTLRPVLAEEQPVFVFTNKGIETILIPRCKKKIDGTLDCTLTHIALVRHGVPQQCYMQSALYKLSLTRRGNNLWSGQFSGGMCKSFNIITIKGIDDKTSQSLVLSMQTKLGDTSGICGDMARKLKTDPKKYLFRAVWRKGRHDLIGKNCQGLRLRQWAPGRSLLIPE